MTRTTGRHAALALLLAPTLAGCGIGYNQTLFATKTNLGIDIDGTPPTAEISIARREGVIQPIFENGKHHSVVASFNADATSFLPFGGSIGNTFAGGNAAAALSGNDPDETRSESLCLSVKPRSGISGAEMPELGEVRPLYFGTDTVLGIKVAWSGMTSAVPDTLRIGYSRKELALAPLAGGPAGTDCANSGGTYEVHMPSFLAAIHSEIKLSAIAESGFSHGQLFATGAAATTLGKDDDLRVILNNAVKKHAAQATAAVSYGADGNSTALASRLAPGNDGASSCNSALALWMKNNNVGTDSLTVFIYGTDFAKQRAAAIADPAVASACK